MDYYKKNCNQNILRFNSKITTERPNILVLRGKNQKRSRTAEHIIKNDQQLNIRSAELSPKSLRRDSENALLWADLVFVMEHDHLSKTKDKYPHLALPQ